MKTFGPPKDRVVRAVGGVLFDLGGQPPNEATRKAIDSMLEAGKKYADSFTEYEKALAEWKKGQKTGPQAREKIEGAKGAKPRDPVSGTWTGKATMADSSRSRSPFTITMKLEGTNVTGTFKMSMGRQGRERETPFTGTFEGGVLKIKATEGRLQIEVEATSAATSSPASSGWGRIGELQIEATRTEGAGGRATSRVPPRQEGRGEEGRGRRRPAEAAEGPAGARALPRALRRPRVGVRGVPVGGARRDGARRVPHQVRAPHRRSSRRADIVTLAPRIGAVGRRRSRRRPPRSARRKAC